MTFWSLGFGFSINIVVESNLQDITQHLAMAKERNFDQIKEAYF